MAKIKLPDNMPRKGVIALLIRGRKYVDFKFDMNKSSKKQQTPKAIVNYWSDLFLDSPELSIRITPCP